MRRKAALLIGCMVALAVTHSATAGAQQCSYCSVNGQATCVPDVNGYGFGCFAVGSQCFFQGQCGPGLQLADGGEYRAAPIPRRARSELKHAAVRSARMTEMALRGRVQRACDGGIVLRAYRPAVRAAIRAQSRNISL